MVVADRYCFGGFPGRGGDRRAGRRDGLRCRLPPLPAPQPVRPLHGRREDRPAPPGAAPPGAGLPCRRRDLREHEVHCEFWSYEKVLASHVLQQEMGIPCCTIEKEYTLGPVGQLRTRFQAFVESLEIKKLGAEKEGEREAEGPDQRRHRRHRQKSWSGSTQVAGRPRQGRPPQPLPRQDRHRPLPRVARRKRTPWWTTPPG